MDLFNAITDELTIPEDLDSTLEQVVEFVTNISESELKLIEDVQQLREFELWETAARGLHKFAYKQGLKDDWWHAVQLVKNGQNKSFWTPAWDAAFDYSVAYLLKPWAGKSYSMQFYELMVEPLETAGFKR